MSKWVNATITYLGQGSFTIKNQKFFPNRPQTISNRQLVEYLRGPRFAVVDNYEESELETKPIEEKPKPVFAPKSKVSKKTPVKKTKKVRKTGVD